MIGLTQKELVALLLNFFLCGVCLGIVYDAIRAFKMLCGVRYGDRERRSLSAPRGALIFCVTFVTDLAFWVFAGIFSIILTFGGGGFFRGSAYLAMGAGFLIYYFTLGAVALKLNIKLVAFIKKILRRFARLLRKKLGAAAEGINSLYHLTIGRIFDKILDGIKSKEAKKQAESDTDNGSLEGDCGREDFVYVDGRKGYRREGRVSFGKKE